MSGAEGSGAGGDGGDAAADPAASGAAGAEVVDDARPGGAGEAQPGCAPVASEVAGLRDEVQQLKAEVVQLNAELWRLKADVVELKFEPKAEVHGHAAYWAAHDEDIQKLMQKVDKLTAQVTAVPDDDDSSHELSLIHI